MNSGNSTCTGTPSDETKTLVAGGVESSASAVPVCGLSYLVHYHGDATYNAADGVCESLVATKLAAAVATVIHDSDHTVVVSAPIGSSVHDKATVTGALTTDRKNVV